MNKNNQGFRVLTGSCEFLIISPHGPVIDGKYRDDIRTGVIAEKIQSILSCTSIINESYLKPKGILKKNAENYVLDLYRIDHAQKIPAYIDAIQQCVNKGEKTLILFIHGIADDIAIQMAKEHAKRGGFSDKETELHALIGFGQGGDPKTGVQKDRLSAALTTAELFKKKVTRLGMRTVLTHRESPLFRGRDIKRMNQWFITRGMGFDRVESMQLEIREKGFRDSDQKAAQTAEIIAHALSYISKAFRTEKNRFKNK